MALQVLSNNGVHPYIFAEAFRSLLVKRRKRNSVWSWNIWEDISSTSSFQII